MQSIDTKLKAYVDYWSTNLVNELEIQYFATNADLNDYIASDKYLGSIPDEPASRANGGLGVCFGISVETNSDKSAYGAKLIFDD